MAWNVADRTLQSSKVLYDHGSQKLWLVHVHPVSSFV